MLIKEECLAGNETNRVYRVQKCVFVARLSTSPSYATNSCGVANGFDFLILAILLYTIYVYFIWVCLTYLV